MFGPRGARTQLELIEGGLAGGVNATLLQLNVDPSGRLTP